MTNEKPPVSSDAPITATPGGAAPHGIHEASHHAYDHHGTNVASLNDGSAHAHHLHKAADANSITADKPLTDLSDARIDKSASATKDATGAPLKHREAGEVEHVHVRVGHKKDDPPANYVVDRQGHIKEQRSPDSKLNAADKDITIEVEAGSKMSKDQQAALDGLEKAVKKKYTKAHDPELTDEMQAMQDRTNAGPSIGTISPKLRGGGVGTEGGPKDWGSSAGNRGGNGGRVPSAAEARARHEDVPYSAPVDWSKLPHGLDRSKQTDRIAALISSNEGTPTSINWNDNGAGVSVGMFQANQRRGELPKLFSDFANTPDGYEALVEAFGPEMAAKIKANPEMIRSLNFSPNNELGKDLENLVQNPAFQQLQLDQLRAKIQEASSVAGQHGVTSEAGVALVADLINQFGEGGANRFLPAADGEQDQEGKARAIASAVRNHSRYGGRYVADLGKMDSAGLSFDRQMEV
jgi:hypothetical protein